ncbi:hypothetical protein [Desulfitobacterium hafniense]|uniref:hypothetical protein n=1 Tax=Desulfitobacterium hafniense TaxID=49338 RepID=UPI001F614C23|nr:MULTISPECIES: hypothetical protein [Desulfitobacterium]MEA5023375.1 hypothetical protein [Desulfitobacterium hafniense]
MTGIEIARLLIKNKVQLKRSFVVIGFCGEEDMRFGTGYFGLQSNAGAGYP